MQWYKVNKAFVREGVNIQVQMCIMMIFKSSSKNGSLDFTYRMMMPHFKYKTYRMMMAHFKYKTFKCFIRITYIIGALVFCWFQFLTVSMGEAV